MGERARGKGRACHSSKQIRWQVIASLARGGGEEERERESMPSRRGRGRGRGEHAISAWEGEREGKREREKGATAVNNFAGRS